MTAVCVSCGHTEDLDTAEERWTFRPAANQWMCEDCWHDDRDFPEPLVRGVGYYTTSPDGLQVWMSLSGWDGRS